MLPAIGIAYACLGPVFPLDSRVPKGSKAQAYLLPVLKFSTANGDRTENFGRFGHFYARKTTIWTLKKTLLRPVYTYIWTCSFMCLQLPLPLVVNSQT